MSIDNEHEYDNENESESDNEDSVQMFYDALQDNDLKKVRMLIRTKPELQKLNPKLLNKEYPLENYKFTSRSGNLVLLSSKSDAERKSFTHEQQKINEKYDDFRDSQLILNNQLINEYNEIFSRFNKLCVRIADIEQRLTSHANTINHIVRFINSLQVE
ncbi:hypothetical protein M9Y10_031267 [Tritrichomonas musculus]|uniref:Uncharacterized protein n=1 Tax=Tritrichomonas musculus TaxID=1915356 RepID=A0ABR2H2H8_9EUKA